MDTRQIQADFDLLASFDDEGWNHNNHYFAEIASCLPARIDRLIDVGCGTGELTRYLASRCRSVLGLDLSESMICRARERSLHPHCQYERANVFDWNEPPGTVDAVVTVATVHHLPLEPFIDHVGAWLAAGGKLVILDLRRDEDWSDFFWSACAVVMNQKERLIRKTPPASIAARRAWQEHAEHDHYLSLREARELYGRLLPGSHIRRRLYWRYCVDWTKPN